MVLGFRYHELEAQVRNTDRAPRRSAGCTADCWLLVGVTTPDGSKFLDVTVLANRAAGRPAGLRGKTQFDTDNQLRAQQLSAYPYSKKYC